MSIDDYDDREADLEYMIESARDADRDAQYDDPDWRNVE